MLAPFLFLDVLFMRFTLIKSLCAAVMGGFTSLPGVVLGGLVVGVAENLFGGYVSTDFKNAFVFSLIIIVLFLRPQGTYPTQTECEGVMRLSSTDAAAGRCSALRRRGGSHSPREATSCCTPSTSEESSSLRLSAWTSSSAGVACSRWATRRCSRSAHTRRRRLIIYTPVPFLACARAGRRRSCSIVGNDRRTSGAENVRHLPWQWRHMPSC